MKRFGFDWSELLEFLPGWETLDPDERWAILRVELNGQDHEDSVQPRALIAAQKRGAELGLLETYREGQRIRAHPQAKATLVALRAMGRHKVTRDGSDAVLQEYVREHVTHSQLEKLVRADRIANRSQQLEFALRKLTQPQHVLGFLAARPRKAWLDGHLVTTDHFGRPVQDEPSATAELAKDLARLVELLVTEPGPLALRKFREKATKLTGPRFARALRAGLRHMLFFACLTPDGIPEIGLHPSITLDLLRPLLEPPEPVASFEPVRLPTLNDDLTTLLVFISQPRRLRAADGEFYSKAQRELCALLTPPPGFMRAGANPFDLEFRISHARRAAKAHALAEKLGLGTKNARLELTGAGRAWLGQSEAQKTVLLTEAARKDLLEPENFDEPLNLGWQKPGLRRFAGELFAALARLEHPMPWHEFKDYECNANNPLFKAGKRGTPATRADGLPYSREALVDAWGTGLETVLQLVLMPHGGVDLGLARGEVGVRLNDCGRYLLGLTDELSVEVLDEPASLIVQADFEIVFLAPHPQLEARIVPFAERIGQGVGALFRLTQASIQSGARAGLDLEQLLGELADASHAQLPANVSAEARRWAQSICSVAWQRALYLRCPDEETALRVLDVAGKYVEHVGTGVLLLADPKKRSLVTRAAAKIGIFLEEPPDEAKPARKKRRRQRYW